jgi:hypothetical protein
MTVKGNLVYLSCPTDHKTQCLVGVEASIVLRVGQVIKTCCLGTKSLIVHVVQTCHIPQPNEDQQVIHALLMLHIQIQRKADCAHTCFPDHRTRGFMIVGGSSSMVSGPSAADPFLLHALHARYTSCVYSALFSHVSLFVNNTPAWRHEVDLFTMLKCLIDDRFANSTQKV